VPFVSFLLFCGKASGITTVGEKKRKARLEKKKEINNTPLLFNSAAAVC
jgi:hypothetical protein